MLHGLRSETRLDAIDAVRAFIADGAYAPGARLPAERALIGSLGISRTTLRRALDALEREGAIWRHVGKGTFVTGEDRAGHGELGRQVTPVRMMRARLVVEPAMAREAAINASTEALRRVTRAMEAAEEAATWEEYETQDDRFHRALAEASDNILLLALFDQLNGVRRAVSGQVVRASARPPDGHTSFAEHRAVARALEARDPAGAHDAMRAHIGSVSARLFGEV